MVGKMMQASGTEADLGTDECPASNGIALNKVWKNTESDP